MKVLDIFVSTETELTIICFMNETLIYLLVVLHEYYYLAVLLTKDWRMSTRI